MTSSRRWRVALTLLVAAGIASCDSGPTDLEEPAPSTSKKDGGVAMNAPPTVSAGEDQIVAGGSQVVLQGFAEDPDGRISSTEWTQTSGTPVKLKGFKKLRTSFTAPPVTTEEVLVFAVTVVDNRGASASDEVNVTVRPGNRPPTVSAGPDQSATPGATVVLAGEATDPDGQVASVAWSQVEGTGVDLQGADQLQASFTAPAAAGENLVFVLTAVDDQGASSSDTTRVTIGTANQPPTVWAGEDLAVEEGTRVVIDGVTSDPDGWVETSTWTQTGGPPVSFKTTKRDRLTFTAPTVSGSAVLVFTLTAVDNQGASSSDDVAVTVKGTSPNSAPTVSAGPDATVALGSLATLEGAASDPDGQIVAITWAQLSGTPVQIQDADQLRASFWAPSVPDILVLTLTVTDDDGAQNSSFVRITVGSGDMVQAGFRYSPYGPAYDPGTQYWADVGLDIASRFPGSRPQAIWIVGEALLEDGGTLLTFPGSSGDPSIHFASSDDNEEALDLFDQIGLDVWLQVEPGNAPVEELIHLILDRYGHHPSVMGVGVDVEWYRWKTHTDGQAVTDAEASAWLTAARQHRPSYRLFLKHWLVEKMPPTVRDGITFIDDSQQFSGLDAMLQEFEAWGRAFSSSPVGFQYGYPADSGWWDDFSDPMSQIGEGILARVPNARGVFWVDFTILDVFPP